MDAIELAIQLGDLFHRVLLLFIQQLLRLILVALKVALAKPVPAPRQARKLASSTAAGPVQTGGDMPDGLVLVGQDHLVRRVVEQVVKRLLLLDLVLDVVLPVVQSPEGIDGPLVLGPHLDIVPMLLHSARDRTSGAVRGERRGRGRDIAPSGRCSRP